MISWKDDFCIRCSQFDIRIYGANEIITDGEWKLDNGCSQSIIQLLRFMLMGSWFCFEGHLPTLMPYLKTFSTYKLIFI